MFLMVLFSSEITIDVSVITLSYSDFLKSAYKAEIMSFSLLVISVNRFFKSCFLFEMAWANAWKFYGRSNTQSKPNICDDIQ